MSDVDLMQTTDHYVWAKEFVKRFGGDEELMATWFASAMMAKHDSMMGPPNGDAAQFLAERRAPTPKATDASGAEYHRGAKEAFQRVADAWPKLTRIKVQTWANNCAVYEQQHQAAGAAASPRGERA